MYGDREDIEVYLLSPFFVAQIEFAMVASRQTWNTSITVETASNPSISQQHARTDGYTNNYGDTIGGKDGDSDVYALGDKDNYSHVGNLDCNLCC